MPAMASQQAFHRTPLDHPVGVPGRVEQYLVEPTAQLAVDPSHDGQRETLLRASARRAGGMSRARAWRSNVFRFHPRSFSAPGNEAA